MCIKCCGPGKRTKDVEKGKALLSGPEQIAEAVANGDITGGANGGAAKMTWPRIDTRNHIKMV